MGYLSWQKKWTINLVIRVKVARTAEGGAAAIATEIGIGVSGTCSLANHESRQAGLDTKTPGPQFPNQWG